MIDAAAGSVPPPRDGCGMTVVIPARNEARAIGATLAALSAQRELGGAPRAPDTFDVVVLANNCTDATAAIARTFAAAHPAVSIHVLEVTFDEAQAHIGTARKAVLDFAVQRLIAAGRPAGIVASIDSDTIADERWIAAIEREMENRDAVAGQVTIAAADVARLVAPVRLLYARELAYRRSIADVEALLDPVAHDPAPHHRLFVGASFAVRADVYLAAGGLPPLRRLEDLGFAHALRRIDARVRHSLLVRATTSARRTARVTGGFGTFMTELHARARHGTSHLVEHPQRTLDDVTLRATLRRIRANTAHPTALDTISTFLGLDLAEWRAEILDISRPLGNVYERVLGRAASTRPHYADVPVELATQALRDAAEAARFEDALGMQAVSSDQRMIG